MGKKKQEKHELNDDSIEVIVEQDEQAQGSATAESTASHESAEFVEDILRSEIEDLNQQLADKSETYLRAVAELDNLRKRNAAELEKARKFAIDKFARALLEVMESLDKACEIDQAADNESIREGIELTRKQLLSVFEKASIRKIEPEVGDPFDPNKHAGMASVPSADMAPNHIYEVFRPGYMIHDRLLRAASVIVSASIPQTEPSAEASGDVADDGPQSA